MKPYIKYRRTILGKWRVRNIKGLPLFSVSLWRRIDGKYVHTCQVFKGDEIVCYTNGVK